MVASAPAIGGKEYRIELNGLILQDSDPIVLRYECRSALAIPHRGANGCRECPERADLLQVCFQGSKTSISEVLSVKITDQMSLREANCRF